MEKINLRRANRLITDFADGFAIDWFMQVKECFKSELDIKYTPRVKNKIVSYEWTQGTYYSFSTGQIIYDSKFAYDSWRTGLEKINYACQIIEAKPDQPIAQQKNSNTTKDIKINGYVKFILYKCNSNDNKLDAIACYNVSQTEFVNFLKNGVIGNENFKIRDHIGQLQLL
ncbi:MAG: hypothetical protein FIB02_10265 [Desulfuromonas sp.]|nr:hypothetical protein [Desulfuromonas sp.]